MINIQPGQDAKALVVWRNNSNEHQAPQMRWDIKKSGPTHSWIEGPVLNVPSVSPGMEGEADIYCTVPNDWAPSRVHAQLMVIGYEGAQWSGEDVYYVTEGGNGEPPPEEGFPWVWALLVGGGAALLAVAASKKKPKKVEEKTKS